jgi:hypothetical protein
MRLLIDHQQGEVISEMATCFTGLRRIFPTLTAPSFALSEAVLADTRGSGYQGIHSGTKTGGALPGIWIDGIDDRHPSGASPTRNRHKGAKPVGQ